jgi:hypothetical protein
MAGTDILAASTGDCRQLPQLTVQRSSAIQDYRKLEMISYSPCPLWKKVIGDS